jgi:hypothetical protein
MLNKTAILEKKRKGKRLKGLRFNGLKLLLHLHKAKQIYNRKSKIYNRVYPFLPASIGTKLKFSKASSLVVPSAFFVIRNMRW